ncbi:MAG TPA: DcrB-related protein [bacterium]|nr:DcrB-related protein [bacterium]
MSPLLPVPRVLTVLACLVAAGSGLVQAQSPLAQIVSDPQGRFAMAFPAAWEVATRADGVIVLVARGPEQSGPRPTVNVAVEPLPEPMTPAAYAARAERLVAFTFHNYTVVQQGSATIAGRPAYYRYFTWEPNDAPPVYQLQAYFTSGRLGFVVTGSTANEADSVRRDMPAIVQILDTFRVL